MLAFFHYPSRRLHLQHYCHAGATDILLPVGSCQSFQSMRTRAFLWFFLLVQDGDANIEFQILNSVATVSWKVSRNLSCESRKTYTKDSSCFPNPRGRPHPPQISALILGTTLKLAINTLRNQVCPTTIPSMGRLYIYLYEWLILHGFHVGKRTIHGMVCPSRNDYTYT